MSQLFDSLTGVYLSLYLSDVKEPIGDENGDEFVG